MPYKSEAQRRFFNSPEGKKKLGEEEVEHWNEVSKGMKLPEKAIDRAIRILDKDETWFLFIDGKHIKTFKSLAAPIKEAQTFMKQNHPGKVGKLTRSTGSQKAGFSITGKEA